MARLPVVDSDDGAWGTILNEFLLVAHNADGTLNRSASASVLVASNDMPTSIKNMADYVCDGTADQTEINNAIIDAASLASRSGPTGATQRGKVQLTGGQFSLSGSILMRTGVTLAGMGQLTELKAASLSTSTGSGTDAGAIKLYDVNTHLTHVRDLWLHGNSSSGGSCHGIYYETSSGGDSHSAYPDTNPDPDHFISNLFISQFTTGTRHGIYMNTDLRGTIINNLQMRGFSGNGIYFNASPDSHISNVHMGTVTDTGFRIAGGNVKLTNCKAFYCDSYGFNITSGRGSLTGCESQDNAIGFNFGTTNILAAGIVADTSSSDNIIIASNRIVINGFTSFCRSGGRYSTTTNGITFTGTPTDISAVGVIDATNVTNKVNGTYTGSRNFVRISDGSSLVSQG